MSGSTEFSLQITEKEWLKKDEFKPVLTKALQAASQGWHDEITHYPAQRAAYRTTQGYRAGEESSMTKFTALAAGKTAGGNYRTYKRTHTLGNTASYQILSPVESKLIGVFYGKYVLKGTKHWAGWPGKVDAIKKRVGARYKAGLKVAMGK